MFRKLTITTLLLGTALGTGTLPIHTASAHVATTTEAVATRSAPVAPAQAAPAAAQELTVAQMAKVQGDGPLGWLKKIWKKYKKQIKKIAEIIVQIIIDEIFSSESSQQVQGISGTVVENYEATDVEEVAYASDADYQASNVSAYSYDAGSYNYVGSDYSGGYYEY